MVQGAHSNRAGIGVERKGQLVDVSSEEGRESNLDEVVHFAGPLDRDGFAILAVARETSRVVAAVLEPFEPGHERVQDLLPGPRAATCATRRT